MATRPLSGRAIPVAALGTQDCIDVDDSQSQRGMFELLLKVLAVTAISVGAGLNLYICVFVCL